ncbi:MAG: NAD-dependent epimerase/dehydratase family protein [Flaviflexus sp.]|uniref:NAD-dependent epimerase/dehydratase family protein n=1 Tax=Flaviflexus sp. TaxID=1969482 RepID=UPI003F92DFCE
MTLLVLGGTGFLSSVLARTALENGIEVVCAARGISGMPPEGTRFIRWDREDPMPEELATISPDVVVDVSSKPGHVREAVGAFPDSRWIYLSSISAYADFSSPGGSPANTPLLKPAGNPDEVDMENYGACKVACENAVAEISNRVIIRPGLISGPGDQSNRFTHWPTRLAQASADRKPYLAPTPPTDLVQWVDVRDLAEWIIDLAQNSVTGTFDAVGQAAERGEFLVALTQLFDPAPEPLWVGPEDLTENEIRPWAGARSLPMWIPDQSMVGMMARDHEPAAEAGLKTRSLRETAKDTLDWYLNHGTPLGLSREDELVVVENVFAARELASHQ